MCGICGYFSFRKKVSSENILKMNLAISHRGPDDEGFWLSDLAAGTSFSGKASTSEIKQKFPLLDKEFSSFALGFRRLSIVDLSEKGHQPMLSADEKVILTFNGEIYNFKEIRTDLESLGHVFQSESDSEVILKSYLEWGTEVFSRFDGMFAICIVDLVQRKLILSRDRLGLKPLFFYHNNEVLVWASEIKSLLKSEFIHPEINWQGVYSNFLFQTTLAPETCFKNIFSVEPGSIFTLNIDDFSSEKSFFWTLPTQITTDSLENAKQKVDDLLSESVSQQLFADVPVASMMSGGIDSTLITAKSKHFLNNISAFTIAYPFSEYEIKNASLVAEKLQIPHHIKKVSDEEIISQLKDNIQHFEEPYSSLEVLMNAAEYASNFGFKVVLSGNGADELFAGYSHSLKFKKWSFLKNFNFTRNFIFTKDAFSRKLKNYFSQDYVFDFFRQSQVGMKPSEAEEIFREEILSQINPDLHRFHLSEKTESKSLFAYDMKYSLSSHHVFRDDLSAMKYGVEFRYPYLSNALIDYVAQLPSDIVFNGRQNKPLLRKVAADYLPDEVLEMPKRGFSFPLAHFIKTEKKMQDFISENLNSLKKRNFFNPKVIDQWWNLHHPDQDFIKIWQLVTFELWFQKYFEDR